MVGSCVVLLTLLLTLFVVMILSVGVASIRN